MLGGCNFDGDVICCYSTCAVSGNENVGGLVGSNEHTIRNCYATGSITGTTNVGGLVGSNDADVTNSFWDTWTSGQTTSAGGTGIMTAEMHISLTFFGWGGWDNEGNSAWTIDEGNNYPRLWWENASGQMIEPTPQLLTHATNPSPADGDLQKDTWVNLSWKPGDFAVSHEVYFGNSLEKVKNGDEDTFQGKQTETYFTVGLSGHPYPEGLVPEVTYYWRINEVDDKQAYGIKQCGDVWSFKVVHKIAYNPNPPDGAMHEETWVTLSWLPGDFTVSHDVYIGDNLEDVYNGIAGTFRGNQTTTFYVPGFPGYAFPDGLIPGTTYYWRIDEVNEAEPNSPWKGNVWSFMVPPRTAYNPDPADGAEFVDPNTILSWTAGFDGKLHIVYIGTDFNDVNDASGGDQQCLANYSPGSLESGRVYYWRIDEFDGANTYKGDAWSFTTLGAVGNPVPPNGAKDVKMTATLSWTSADNAVLHEVYFGEDKDDVRNAGKNSPEYKGSRALCDERYDPGKLAWYATYYWRVDEVDGFGNSTKGPIWSFTTADFIVVDDFESYDANNQVWFSWYDGLGYGVPPDGYPGNGTGAVVGDETWMWGGHMETEIVHGGWQSMPYCYDNDRLGCFKYSEATLTLGYPRDWNEEGVGVLSLWFYGTSANAPEPMYVAIANNTSEPAVVYHDDPSAAGINTWTEWVIPLQTFAEQGIDLTDVDSFAIGFGDRYNPQPGGGGLMYFDDIRLYRPRPAESLDLEVNIP